MPLLEIRCKTDHLPKSVVQILFTIKHKRERDRKKWEGGSEGGRKREREISRKMCVTVVTMFLTVCHGGNCFCLDAN